MNFGLISFNYDNTPLQIREKINLTDKSLEKAYNKKVFFIRELVILSTCNRTELYFITDDNKYNKAVSELLEMMINFFDINEINLKSFMETKDEFAVIKHLFKVASGLKSQVPGEQQILGQVKNAQKKAIDLNSSGKYLNFIFRKAITNAKKVRTETGLSDKNLSISSVAVSFIEKKFSELKDKDILVIGVGEMSRIALKILQDKGIKNIYATNRTHGKAVKISNYYDNIIPVNYSRLHKIASKVEIVLSSTSAPHYLVFKNKLKQFINKTSEDKKRIFVDLGVPRDIDPEINNLPGIEIYNLDQINEKMEENEKFRLLEVDKAEEIIKKGLKEVQDWRYCQKIVPVIKNINRASSEIINEELKKFYYNNDIEADIKDEIENFARHLGGKLFNDIILNLKKVAKQDKCDRKDIKMLQEIFDM